MSFDTQAISTEDIPYSRYFHTSRFCAQTISDSNSEMSLVPIARVSNDQVNVAAEKGTEDMGRGAPGYPLPFALRVEKGSLPRGPLSLLPRRVGRGRVPS